MPYILHALLDMGQISNIIGYDDYDDIQAQSDSLIQRDHLANERVFFFTDLALIKKKTLSIVLL